MSTKRISKKAGTAAATKKTPKGSPATKTSGRRTAKKATPVKAAPKRTAKAKERDPRLPTVGTKLTRAYHDKEHVVEVVDGGFRYQGETFTSLTALAKKITGYKAISGPAFFGLWKRAEAK